MLLLGWCHGWPGHPRCMPVRQVIIPSKQVTAFISINRGIYIEMRLWVMQKGGRVKGERVFTTKVTACSIACFWGFDAVNTPSVLTSATRRWAEAHGKLWAVTWKLKTEITEFSLDGTKLGPLAFRCMSGRSMVKQQSDWHALLWGWKTLASGRCGEGFLKVLGYWMVTNNTISSAHNALWRWFIPRVQAKRMKSQCLLYLILAHKSNAFWVIQAMGIGLVIMLVITESRKPTSISMT